jgi:glycosyltransferase involved in cell wall biosynthesis
MISSLKLYERAFDRVLYICVSEDMPDPQIAMKFSKVRFRHFQIRRAGYTSRFLMSIPTGYPACVMQMHQKELHRAIIDAVKCEIMNGGSVWCIIENLAPTVFIKTLKAQCPTLKLVYRSHDVSELAFAPFAERGPLPIRWAWAWELARIHRLEASSLDLADFFWAITSDDAQAFTRLHKRACDGVLGVQIDLARYASIPAGANNRLLYLGSSDIRKAKGLYQFLAECWPLVRQRHPDIELCIGGPGTERFADAGPGIQALGFVDDELKFLGFGRALINPQLAGTGIKLKSLVALAAEKLLISTRNGVMGIVGGASGEHFLASDTPAEMAQNIGLLINDPKRVGCIAAAGRELVRANYDITKHTIFDYHLDKLLITKRNNL